MVGPIKIFYSYSHADERMRDRLAVHFGSMRNEGLITDWHDRKIPAGDEWDGAIRDELNTADIILLLVSPDFINSRYCHEVEVKRAMERHHDPDDDAKVIPVSLRDCDFTGTPFGKLQGPPKNFKPVCNWRPQDTGYADVARAVRKAAEVLRDKRVAAAEAAKAPPVVPLTPRATVSLHFSHTLLGAPLGPVNAVAPPKAPPPPPPPPDAAVDIHRLPTSDGQLFGRDAMFEALDGAWSDVGTGVAVVVAEGGTGKSVLVDRWLSGLRDRRWDGARRVFGWSFYSQGSDRQGAADDFFAEALKFFGHEGEVPLSAWDRGLALAELLRAEKGLLILDGLEPLQYGEAAMRGRLKDQGLQALLRTLARKGHSGLCLVTSRLPVSDLERHEGKGLRSVELGGLSPDAGADLLAARGVKGTQAQLEKLAARFGGHALSLSLLAVYLGFHDGEAEAAKTLRRHRPTGGGDDHARRVLDGLAPLLTPAQGAVMSMVGLFDRPADMELIQALREPVLPGLEVAAEEWDEAVAGLRALRLLLPHDHAHALDAHPVVRQYFGDRLKAEEPDVWKAAHARLFEALCAAAPGEPETVEEMTSLIQAMRHGVEAGRAQAALDEVFWRRINRRSGFLVSQLGAFGLSLSALSPLFPQPWLKPLPDLTPDARSFVMGESGFALRGVGRLEEALAPMKAGLVADERLRDWWNAAVSASNMVEILMALGRLEEALSLARTAVAHADRDGRAFQRAVGQSTLADVLARLGRRDEAMAIFAQAEQVQAKHDPDAPRLYSLGGYRYCTLLLDQGRWAEVAGRAEAALAIARHQGWRLEIGLDTLSQARAAHESWRAGEGETASVGHYFDAAVTALRSAGSVDFLVPGLIARADFRLDVDDLDAAADDLDEAREIAEAGGMRLYLADILLAEGKLAILRGAAARARALLDQAGAEIDAMGYHRRDGRLAELCRRLGA